jgi:hypothetical protein
VRTFAIQYLTADSHLHKIQADYITHTDGNRITFWKNIPIQSQWKIDSTETGIVSLEQQPLSNNYFAPRDIIVAVAVLQQGMIVKEIDSSQVKEVEQ